MATNRSGATLAAFGGWGWAHWLAVALSLAIAAVNAWVGVTRGEPPLLLVAASFLLGVGLFLTRFWQPVLYLLGVVYMGVLFVLWLLSGMQFRSHGLVVGALSVALAAVAMYLFVTVELDE